MSNTTIRVHVLYESSSGGVPHGCSEIRLLRPLSHSSLQSEIILSSGLEMPRYLVDVVIIERLWDYSCNMERHGAFLHQLRKNNILVIYEIDDDLLSLNTAHGDSNWPTTQQKMWIRWMLRSADGVIVSTQSLADRLTLLNKKVEVVPNALDDRLFEQSREFRVSSNNDQLIFGYMGTLTHMEDLISIIGPLRRVLARHKNYITFEIVGVGDGKIIESAFCGLPVRIRQVPHNMVTYGNFAEWMQQNLRWDFGIAPLINSVFTKSKSDIKFLDYAVQGIPGIFSAVPAYKDTVRHMENGLLAETAEEWEDCLERFVKDNDLRLRLGEHAHTEVWKNRMLTNMARSWIVAIQNISARQTGTHRLEVGCESKLSQSPISNLIQPKKPKSTKNIFARVRIMEHEEDKRMWFSESTFLCLNPNLNLTRNEKLLQGLNLAGIGLEIGASYSPVVPKKAGFCVEIIDYADAETLRKKYEGHGVDIENIEDVDYVWSGEPLNELTGKTEYYDWIIASHVIEHTPDLIAFLQQCEQLLKPGGILSLAIPDHRYCFDIFRSTSTPGDVIQAHLARRIRHSPGAIWDHFSMVVRKGDTVAWEIGHQGNFSFIHSINEAKFMFDKAIDNDEYIDIHNLRFTPFSFRLILEDICLLGFLKDTMIQSFFPTVGCEFIVQLKKSTVNKKGDPLLSNSANRLGILQKCLAECCEKGLDNR